MSSASASAGARWIARSISAGSRLRSISVLKPSGSSRRPWPIKSPGPSRRSEKFVCGSMMNGVAAGILRAGSDRGRAEVRVGVAVARRVGGAEQIVGVEIRAQGASGLRVEQLDLHAQALLERHAAPGDGQLVLVADQDQIAVLAEVGVDA